MAALKAKMDHLHDCMSAVRGQVSQAVNSTSWIDQAAHAKRALQEIEKSMEAVAKVLDELVEDRCNA